MLKLGTQTGSFINHLKSEGDNKPEVGKGATELLWSDRRAYFVDWVSEDKKECIIEGTKAVRIDNQGMSDSQDYSYDREENPYKITLRFTHGKWRNKKTRQPMNIQFGYMREYYDFSF